jgi:hypothetical protein
MPRREAYCRREANDGARAWIAGIPSPLRMPPENRYNFLHYASLTLPFDPLRYLDLDL